MARQSNDEGGAAAAVRAILVAIATDCATITYADLAARAGMEVASLGPVLRAVAIAEDEDGRGLLSAVVVRGDTGRPGAGFFDLAASRGRAVADRDAARRAELTRVHAAHAGAGPH